MKYTMRSFILSLVILSFMASCTFTCSPGTGEIVQKEVDLDLISAIVNESAADVEIRYGQYQKIEFIGYENHFSWLNTEVRSKEWTISFEDAPCTEDLLIRVTLPNISSIELSGSGDIQAMTPFQVEELNIECSGSGDLHIELSAEQVSLESSGSGDCFIKGLCEELDIESHGSGDIEASELESEVVVVEINGSGDVSVFAGKEIEVDSNGSGDVVYGGEAAKRSIEENGSGRVSQR